VRRAGCIEASLYGRHLRAHNAIIGDTKVELN